MFLRRELADDGGCSSARRYRSPSCQQQHDGDIRKTSPQCCSPSPAMPSEASAASGGQQGDEARRDGPARRPDVALDGRT